MSFYLSGIKPFIRKLIALSSNTQSGQYFYNKLFRLALFGMNLGTGGRLSISGEEYVIEYLAKKMVLLKQPVIFDVGASTGLYTEKLLTYFKDDVKIFSFEPSATFYNSMIQNLQDNKNVFPFKIALGDHQGNTKLYSSSKSRYLGSLFHRDIAHTGYPMDQEETIEVDTLEHFCNANNITHIDFLKMDVEGNELNILIGAKKLLDEGRIDYIQFEFSGCNIDSRTYFKDFFKLLNGQYRFYRVLRKGLFEIMAYDEFQEIFLTSNYLLERKR